MTHHGLSRRQFLAILGAATSATRAFIHAAIANLPATAPVKTWPLVRPYLQPGPSAGDGLDSKVVTWLTDEVGGDFSLEYGWEGSSTKTAVIERIDIRLSAPTAEQLKKKTPVSKEEPDAEHEHDHAPSPSGEREQHYIKFKAALIDLPRDAKAWYRVRAGKKTISEQSFKTRATASRGIRFIAVGDLANGKAGQNAIAYQASQLHPDFVLALGDIVYPTGRVSQYMDHFWRTYVNVERADPALGAPLMANVPFYAVLGNHDVDTSLNAFPDCLGIYYFFHAPTNGPGEGKWSTPISKEKQEAARFRQAVGASYPSLGAYSFDDGPAHFIVLDSNGYVKIDSPELLAWIERDLTASKAKWKFVCQHAPMFHSSPAHYTEQKIRRLSPLLEKCGVDVVFSGHVHNYQRSKPICFAPDPPKPGVRLVDGVLTIDAIYDGITHTRPKGIIHIVSGGGGGTLYKDPVEKTASLMQEKFGANWAPFTARHVVDRHSLTYCELSPTQLTIRAVDQSGAEIDRAIITKD